MKAFGQSMQQAMRQRQAFGAGFGRSMGEVGTGVARASHSMEKFAQAMRNGMAYAAPFRGSLNGMYVAMSAFEQTTGRAMQYLACSPWRLGPGHGEGHQGHRRFYGHDGAGEARGGGDHDRHDPVLRSPRSSAAGPVAGGHCAH